MNRAEEEAREAARARSDRLNAQRDRERAAAAAETYRRRVLQPFGAALAEQERQRREAVQVTEEREVQTAAQAQAAREASAARMRAHLGLDRQPLDDGEPRFESQVSDDPAVVAAVARMRGARA